MCLWEPGYSEEFEGVSGNQGMSIEVLDDILSDSLRRLSCFIVVSYNGPRGPW
jgi:hypothetical protein